MSEIPNFGQWVKAVYGLRYLKEGLAPFCKNVADQHHRDMVNKICQQNCKCLRPSCKNCQNNICDLIKEEHVYGKKPNLKNTDEQKLTLDPWSVAKCYIYTGGYDDKATANDTDCSGLLTVILNNKYFLNHISLSLQQVKDSKNIFAMVRQYRNEIFHLPSIELEESESNKYIDDMISILQDGKELVNNPDAQEAVKKLKDLKNKDFINTFENVENLNEVLHQLNGIKSTVSTKEEVKEVERKISIVDDWLKQFHEKLDGIKAKVESSHQLAQETIEKVGGIEANIDMLMSNQAVILYTRRVKDSPDEKQTKSESTQDGSHRTNKRKLSEVERPKSKQKGIKKSQRVEESPDEKQLKYEKTKSDWRKIMIKLYRDTVLKVPAMPLLRNEKCEFSTIYVRPKIVSEEKDKDRETKETEIKSASEIFRKNDVPVKYVYVVGDAGTGKTSFCNYLVNCWCMAHSEGQIVEDEEEFGGIEEMKKFEFLFLISLRHNKGKDSVYKMLQNKYNIDILDTLLEKESAKVIILLDGLDEWSSKGEVYGKHPTANHPKRDVFQEYKIVTTSRPWKSHTLEISDDEIHQVLKLKGFDDQQEKEMVEKTVKILNSKRKEKKNGYDCQRELREPSLSNLKQVPIMLQQLICLWFDGKIAKASKCAVYTGMLKLFFTWNEQKGTVKCASSPIEVHLPKYLAKCESNGHLIHYMSQLAYETLFKCSKDQSLSFDIDVLKQLKISDEIRDSCLKIGLLTEDRCPSLLVSEPPSSMFSFIHKSVQEFLAAVNIAINYNSKVDSSKNSGNTEVQRDCNQFVQEEVFKNCSTVNEILEQSNVIIMLCGLEPRLATHVSSYIYDVVKGGQLVDEYRKTVEDHHTMKYEIIRDIHKLIFDSMEECNASPVENSPIIHIGDLVIDGSCEIVCSCIEKQQLKPESVRSIGVYFDYSNTVEFLKHLSKFEHLEKIWIEYNIRRVPYKGYMFCDDDDDDDDYYDDDDAAAAADDDDDDDDDDNEVDKNIKIVAGTIEKNASTLKCLSVKGFLDITLCKGVFLLHSMENLVAIQMKDLTMSHDDTRRFCEFLEGTSHLEQIHIDISCKCESDHDVDLSKHQQLKYLKFGGRLCVKFNGTVNLQVLDCRELKKSYCMKVFDSVGKCVELKELTIHHDDPFYTITTDRLVPVLPLLHNLGKLELMYFRLTDNIIQKPSEMKNLKDISLRYVRMSLTTWKKFVDSLPSIPHNVNVEVWGWYITGDDWKICRNDEEKRNEAEQYVKDRDQLFYVLVKKKSWFKFSTKKVKVL